MFIPFESVNLYIFIEEMIIFPLKYYKGFDELKSIQKPFSNYILVSKERWIADSNISFEVELDKTKLIQLDNNFFLYPKTIPFQDVKNIWFQNEERMKRSIINIEISTTNFPKYLAKIDKPISAQSYFQLEKLKKISLKNRNISKDIIKYSKVLGALAIQNNILKVTSKSCKYLIDKKYDSIKKIVLKRAINKKDIEYFAGQENIKLEKFLDFYILDNMSQNSLTYIIIILEKYKYKMSDNLAGLLIEIKNLDVHLRQNISILYGLMLGYKNLPFIETNSKFNIEHKNIFNKVYKSVFREKINKVDRLEQLKNDILEKNFDEVLEKFGVSETTLKPNIRKTILESDISVSKKIELFEKFSLRVPKNLRITKLKEILKNVKFTSKELAEKLKVSINTVRNYLKDIPVEKIRDGKIINYSLK